MEVLVAGSPCALAISTPSAVLSAIARAAKERVLIKGGKALEIMGSLDAIAFDKTGTLTKGKPVVKNILNFNISEKELYGSFGAVSQGGGQQVQAAFGNPGNLRVGRGHEQRQDL